MTVPIVGVPADLLAYLIGCSLEVAMLEGLDGPVPCLEAEAAWAADELLVAQAPEWLAADMAVSASRAREAVAVELALFEAGVPPMQARRDARIIVNPDILRSAGFIARLDPPHEPLST